jgi:cell division protein FtsW (lipid II flippase)
VGGRRGGRSGLTTVFDYKWLRSFAWPLYFINIVLLILTLRLGQGTGEAGTAARWVKIAGFQFQFSELAKIVMILVFAAYLANRVRRRSSRPGRSSGPWSSWFRRGSWS